MSYRILCIGTNMEDNQLDILSLWCPLFKGSYNSFVNERSFSILLAFSRNAILSHLKEIFKISENQVSHFTVKSHKIYFSENGLRKNVRKNVLVLPA